MEPDFVKIKFPVQWLRDKETRSKLWQLQRTLKSRATARHTIPKRPYVFVKKTVAETGASNNAYNAIEADYFTRHPSHTIRISLWEEDKANRKTTRTLKKGRTLRDGHRLVMDVSLALNYWDTTIPEDTPIKIKSKSWFKLLTVLLRENVKLADRMAMRSFSADSDPIAFLTVHVIGTVPRPVGALIDEPVRDGTSALPTHRNLLVHYWNGHFEPVKHGLATEGDCLPRAVVNALKPSFDKNLKKVTKILTIQHVLDVCNSPAEMSIPQLKPFLEKYHVSLTVWDIRSQVLWRHTEARNKKMTCRLDLVLHNKHVELLNHDMQSLERSSLNTRIVDTSIPPPKPHFFAPTFKTDAPLTTWDEIQTLMATKPTVVHKEKKTKDVAPRESDTDESDRTRVYYQPAEGEPTIDEVFGKIARQPNHGGLGLEAKLTLNTLHQVKELRFEHPAITIVKSDLKLSTLQPLLPVFEPRFKSNYSPTLMDAFSKDYRRAQLVCRFRHAPERAHVIDRVRSYTDNASKLKFIPVFDSLDDFIPYVPHALEDYTLYVVKATSTGAIRNKRGISQSEPGDIRRFLIANRRYNIVSGMVLKASGMHFPILAQCKPSGLQRNPLYGKKGLVAELYNTPSDDLKNSINIVLGISGKTVARKIEGRFTTDTAEAWHLNENRPPTIFQHGYLLPRSSQDVQLVDGYYPLQFMVYDLQRLRMLELYDRLTADGVNVYGMHTDCFFVDSPPDWEYHTGVKTFDSLGMLRCDGEKDVPLEYAYLVENNPLKLVTPTPYKQVTTLQSNTFIGGVAGASKTGDATRFMGCWKDQPVLNTKSLIVSYSGELQHTERKRTHNADYATYAGLLGDKIDDKKNVTRKRAGALKLEDYTHILLDELCLLPPSTVSRVVKLLENRGLSLLGTGDYDQNSTHGLSNLDRETFFEKSALWRLFPNRIYRTENVRLQGENRERDQSILRELLADFKKGIPVETAIQRLNGIAKATASLDFNRFICYTNEACAIAEERFIAEPRFLKCNVYDSKKMAVTALAVKTNLTLQLDGYDDNVCFVVHEGKRHQYLIRKAIYEPRYVDVKGVRMVGVEQDLYKRSDFVGIHATTGHSAQGSTIAEPFLIIGWDHSYADWRWVWTAITRCTRLEDVHFFTGEIKEQRVAHIKEKLRQYRATDDGKGHANDLTEEWVRKTLNDQRNQCGHCERLMTLDYKPGDLKQWSVDRRDNSRGHLQSNCWITCLSCNHRLAP